MKTLYYLFISLRPKQWIKNLSLFVAIFFSQNLFIEYKFIPVLKGFAIFCLLSSAIYLFNDYRDREKDKLHPGKKIRPIAAGKISPQLALVSFATLSFISLSLAWLVSQYFFVTCVVYWVLFTAYSLFLRNVILLDGMVVASGFVLRVWAGAFIAATPISSWLIICTIATALLMAFGRRRCELTILKSQASQHRATLHLYPEKLLDTIISSVTAFTLVSYSLFTFFEPVGKLPALVTSLLPEYWFNSKWLMITIPIVLYGVFRYLFLIYEKGEAASPEEAIFNDVPLFSSIIIWLATNFVLLYLI